MEKNNKTSNASVPSVIEGIPTAKWATKECRSLITGYYDQLWKQLQKEVNSNYITNEFLKADVYIVKGESDKKAKNNSAHNWRSTYALLDFWVKLTIGIKTGGKHIQYAVNKVDVEK